jgi:hypothetical protein
MIRILNKLERAGNILSPIKGIYKRQLTSYLMTTDGTFLSDIRSKGVQV